MFSIGNFLENNKNSVDQLLEQDKNNIEENKIKVVFEEIEKDCLGDEQLEKYFSKLKSHCYKYTEVVCQFNQLFNNYQAGELSEEEYRDNFKNIDQTRHFIHNATIDAFNILARLMKRKGKNSEWIQILTQGGRIAYGKYAMEKTILDLIEFNKKNYINNGGNHEKEKQIDGQKRSSS